MVCFSLSNKALHFKALKLNERKNYFLLVYSESEHLEQTAIKKQIAQEEEAKKTRERQNELKKLKNIEQRKKATERKIEKAKELLAKLQTPTQ